MGESMAAIYREELPEMLDILDPSEEENNNLVVDSQALRIQNQRRMLHERFNYANSVSTSNTHHHQHSHSLSSNNSHHHQSSSTNSHHHSHSLSSNNLHHSNGIYVNGTSTSNCGVVTSPVLPHRSRSIVHTLPYNDPDFDDDVVVHHNGYNGVGCTDVTSIPHQQQAPSPVPDLLRERDWESITEEEIDNFISTQDSGQEVQRISVITTLPDLLKENNADCMRRVVPKVREVLHVAQTDMQLAACSAFLQILRNDLVPVANYTTTFLQTILMSLDSRNAEVAEAWLETLLDVIDLLPKDIIKKDILAVAIAKGQITKPVQSRLACCRILGKIATKFEPFVIKKDILPTVQSLCQDVDYEVRACMCRQLHAVARGLGLEQTKSAILPELVELTKDEEKPVQLAGLDTVVEILGLLDDETCSNTIIPLVSSYCQQALSSESTTLPAVARHIGKLAHGLQGNLQDEQRSWFITFFKRLCRIGISAGDRDKREGQENNSSNRKILKESPPSSPVCSPLDDEEEDPLVECRKNAAFNFPAMVLFCGGKNFRTDLYVTFSHLCTDPHFKVRRSVAAGFHEIVKLLGNNSCHILSDLIVLLKDDATEVLQGLVDHLPETLEMLHKSVHHGTNANVEVKVEVPVKTPGVNKTLHPTMKTTLKPVVALFAELVPALLSAEGVIAMGHNWRLQEQLMQQWANLYKVFSSDQIHDKFIPLLFSKLQLARVLPVRTAACRTLLLLLRHNSKLQQRTDACKQLVANLCQSHSCRQRSLYVDCCKLVLEFYSRAFFKEFFFERLLDLTVDKVPNVRLRVCPLLPQMKGLVKLPTDRLLLQQLESSVRKMLQVEKDKDVRAVLEKTIKKLDLTEVLMESLTKKPFYEDDILDVKREEEEKKLIELEEKERKEEELKSAKGERKKGDKKESKIPAPKKGSKIPAATGTALDKAVRSERSGSFAGLPSPAAVNKDVKRTPSFNNKPRGKGSGSQRSLPTSPRLGSRVTAGTGSTTSGSTTSPANRKGSASSTSISRRSSIPASTSSATDVAASKKSPGSRRTSTGSLQHANANNRRRKEST